jgi:hypothetical protein
MSTSSTSQQHGKENLAKESTRGDQAKRPQRPQRPAQTLYIPKHKRHDEEKKSLATSRDG